MELGHAQKINALVNTSLEDALVAKYGNPSNPQTLTIPAGVLLHLLKEREVLQGNAKASIPKKKRSQEGSSERIKRASRSSKKDSQGSSSSPFINALDSSKPASKDPRIDLETVLSNRYYTKCNRVLSILEKNRNLLRLSKMEAIQDFSVKPLNVTQALCYIQGPSESSVSLQSYGKYVSGRSISTFPQLKGKPNREGDPICDYYYVKLYENRVLCCVSDGHGWGKNSQKASKLANKSMMEMLQSCHKLMVNVRTAGPILTASVFNAYQTISKAELQGVACTSLMGGILMEIIDSPSNGASLHQSIDDRPPKFSFAFISVGDCSCFKYDTKEKSLSLISLKKFKKPGFIGSPFSKTNDLFIRDVLCNQGDFIIMCTKGITDNFDPLVRGTSLQTLRDLAETQNITVNQLRTNLMVQFANSLLEGSEVPSAERFVKEFIGHSKSITKISRNVVRKNPSVPLSSNSSIQPGKMDHSTCVSFLVDRVTMSYEEYHS